MLLPLTLLSFTALQEPVLLPAPAPETPRDAHWGEAPVMDAELQSDDVPLPVPAVWRSEAEGDVMLAPPSGDPFFLGFAAGKHYPPAGERIDPELARNATRRANDARPTSDTYAFVMFSKRMTAERVAELRGIGVRVLDFHPFYTLKVALAPELVERVGALDYVRWIGVARRWQKVHPRLLEELDRLAPGARIAVHVNLFESDLCAESRATPVGSVEHSTGPDTSVPGDPEARPGSWMSNGWQQRALQELGVEVRSYDDSIQAFRAELDPTQLEQLLALDFVQFVEPELVNTTCHDESMPLINADRTRVNYDGGTNSAAVVGVIDSGCDLGHTALDQYTVGWDFTSENLGPFEDFDGHGSHVWGSILANDDVDDSYQGVAPGLGWGGAGRVFSAKIYNSAGSSVGVDYAAVLTAMHTSYNDGTNTTPRPMVVNNSYGLGATGATGTEAAARSIDAEVWDHDQLYIFAAGNEGPGASTCRIQATAKNALTVGSVADFRSGANDPGTVANSSSRGPCGDGRWKPNVCAPGTSIYSVAAETVTGYTSKSGTSMATPHVTGLAGQLLDHYSFLRYNPEALSAVLMATAITKDDALLSSPAASAPHLNDYGTGRVDAYKAHWGDSQQSLYFWSTTLSYVSSTFVEFPINTGATRVTIVVHYKEPEASSGASQALRNDFDTWIDASPFSAGNAAGDYTAQQSSVDNTEVRSLNNPTATDWRIKISPVATIPFESVRVGICAVVTYGDTTPNTTLDLTALDYYVKPNEDVDITALYTNPSYVASAVYLDSTSTGSTLAAAYGNLIDGSSASWLDNQQLGRDISLGNVVHGTSRTAHWTARWASEGLKSFAVEARSDNALDETQSIGVFVDGTQPATVTNLHSTTHTANVWTNDTTITYAWTPATDNLAGIDGYGVFTTVAASQPGATKDIEEVSSFNETLGQGTWWFSIRSLDYCGNWDDDYASFGPVRIDTTAPTLAQNLASTTHTLGQQSCSTTVNVTWSPASDALSGLGGYIGLWNTSPSTTLSGSTNLASGATSYSVNIGSSSAARYFHLAAKDAAGNVGATAHFGPIYANAASVGTYCVGKLNSQGCTPAIGTNGAQPSRSAGNFAVTCANALNNKNGLLFWGFASSATPFQGGTKCVASPTVRTPTLASGGSASGNDCTGTYSFNFSTAYMTSMGIDPGETLFAQWWMRDPASPSTTGLSNGLRFTVCQ